MAITIRNTGVEITVQTPYDPRFPQAARDIGGRPSKTDGQWTWHFDPRDEDRVRDLCRDIYGTDGRDDADAPTITLRIPVAAHPDRRQAGEFRAAGRTLVRRPARDADVTYGPGVVLISGGFPGCGGSARYPELDPQDGTVVEVRDLPHGAAAKMLTEVPGATAVVPDTVRAALLRERDTLATQLAAIDALLSTDGK